MSFLDTKERIFVNGQIYSRPKGSGRVHGPDNRKFTPDPNPYDVPPEPRVTGRELLTTLLKFYRLTPLCQCRTPNVLH